MRGNTRLVLAGALFLIVAASLMRSRGAEGIVAIGPEGESDASAGLESESTGSPEPEASAAILPSVPVGVVVAWMKSQTNTPALPREWVQCDGQTLGLPGSPYDGTTIPNLNGADGAPQRFLRGALSGGESGGTENHQHGRMLIDRSGKRTVNVSSRIDANHLPPYFDIVWIMKVAD